jgi:hypothetical protein
MTVRITAASRWLTRSRGLEVTTSVKTSVVTQDSSSAPRRGGRPSALAGS